MAAGPFALYNTAKKYFFDGTFVWGTTQFRTELLKQPYTFSAAHDTWSDVSAQVCTDGDYTAGRAMATASATVVGGTGTATAKVDSTTDVAYGPSVTITAKWLVVRTGAATATANHKLVGAVDLNTASATAVVSSTNGDFTIQWNANGLFTVA